MVQATPKVAVMNKIITLLFSLVYVFLACFLGLLGSIHGPKLLPYFALSLLVLLLSIWWRLCFLIPARVRRHPLAMLTFSGIGLGVLLVAAISAGQRPLVNWEVRQMERRAAATEVADMRDEPLLWLDATPIGIRLHYSMSFPDNDYFWQTPFLFSSSDLGYTVGWNIVRESVEPSLQIVQPGADLVPIETAHLPPNVRWHERGKVYRFTVDLVPDFLALSADGSKVCFVRPPAQFATGLETLFSREDAGFYSITISGTNYRGLTRNSYSLKTIHDGAIKHGSADCRYKDGRISFQ